jgi:hypothetical protein
MARAKFQSAVLLHVERASLLGRRVARVTPSHQRGLPENGEIHSLMGCSRICELYSLLLDLGCSGELYQAPGPGLDLDQ